ncbi:MAG: glycosyltransferase family 4 protein [Actinobacteria bacterium]|nr:glycosyltransferase family 4 protein [Actinomycetota bacterium]
MKKPNGISNDEVNVAFICAGDAEDRLFSSGVYFYMLKALRESGCKVASLGPVQPFYLTLGKHACAFTRALLGKNYDFLHTYRLSKAYARIFREKILSGSFDIVFAQEASAEIAFLDIGLPIVYGSDATFALMKDYYPFFTDLLKISAKRSDAIESMAIRKAAALIYPTEWASRSAAEDYGADAASINIIPFGPNLDALPSRGQALKPKDMQCCNLLFIGRKWARKGGDIAIGTFFELKRMNVPARLTICGCVPPVAYDHPDLSIIPSLDKNDEEQRARLFELYSQAHFLIMPSRAETAGFTISEAAAFGLPVIAARTGGIPDLVQEGVNGSSSRLKQEERSMPGLYNLFIQTARNMTS